jgi:6-phosphogluconate dehydrogenase
MELIAESYDLMKRGLGLGNGAIGQAFRDWDAGVLGGFLVEITAGIFAQRDPRTGGDLVDAVLGVARQMGTGQWTSQSALELQVPAPTIDLAVAQRDLSALDALRAQASRALPRPVGRLDGDPATFLPHLERALHASMAVAFAQGFALLAAASERYGYHLDLATVARIWRGGCIIRAGLLEPIAAAYGRRPDLVHLLLDPDVARAVQDREDDLRAVVGAGARVCRSRGSCPPWPTWTACAAPGSRPT